MKKAIVLSGGGVGGAYQAGALNYLINEKKYKFDIICGSSVGAMNGSWLAQYKTEDDKKAVTELVLFWKNITTKSIHKRWFPFGKLQLWKKSLYNNEPMKQMIYRIIDSDKLKTSGKILKVGTVSLTTSLYKTYDQNSENIIDAIIASASYPLFFQPHKVGDDLEYDACVREYAPLKHAIDSGADEIVVISNYSGRLNNVGEPEKLKFFGILKRFMSTMSDEIVLNDLEKIKKMNRKVKDGAVTGKRYIKCTLIRPNGSLTDDILDFDPEVVSELLERGYSDARKIVK